MSRHEQQKTIARLRQEAVAAVLVLGAVMFGAAVAHMVLSYVG